MFRKTQFTSLSNIVDFFLSSKKGVKKYLIANKVIKIASKIISKEFKELANKVKIEKFKDNKLYISSYSPEILSEIKAKEFIIKKGIIKELPVLKEINICYKLK